MPDDNVVPLFPTDAGGAKPAGTALIVQEPIFFRFPKGTRFEFTKAGEMIISLDPDAEEMVEHTWASYINATCAALILNRIEHRVQFRKGPEGKPTIPDVLRISLVTTSGAQQQCP